MEERGLEGLCDGGLDPASATDEEDWFEAEKVA